MVGYWITFFRILYLCIKINKEEMIQKKTKGMKKRNKENLSTIVNVLRLLVSLIGLFI